MTKSMIQRFSCSHNYSRFFYSRFVDSNICFMFTSTNTNTTTIMKTFNNLEDQILDIIEKKSNIEMAWMPTSHIAKLCHIIGFRTSIDEVESILGKLLFEQKIILQFNDNGEELFFIA